MVRKSSCASPTWPILAKHAAPKTQLKFKNLELSLCLKLRTS